MSMREEGYGVSVHIGRSSLDFVAETYDAAMEVLRSVLGVVSPTVVAASEVVDLVDDRVVVYDQGTVAELLAWPAGHLAFNVAPGDTHRRYYGIRPPTAPPPRTTI